MHEEIATNVQKDVKVAVLATDVVVGAFSSLEGKKSVCSDTFLFTFREGEDVMYQPNKPPPRTSGRFRLD